MPIERHSNEAPLGESGPSVLALLTTPLDPEIVRFTLEQKIEGYRQQIAESELALIKQRNRRDDLLRRLAEEEAKNKIELPLT
ncbi:hypothetical protein [Bradyrhizobium sp.]|uniref:hypothetical protein n=1 Tax=Bradyrhizobium sp. TaxID=376 RepID=UPI002625D199|nr:hypothetical protein [Bradyrhizobium sp.]